MGEAFEIVQAPGLMNSLPEADSLGPRHMDKNCLVLRAGVGRWRGQCREWMVLSWLLQKRQ